MTVAITRLDLSAAELRQAAARTQNGKIARRMLAVGGAGYCAIRARAREAILSSLLRLPRSIGSGFSPVTRVSRRRLGRRRILQLVFRASPRLVLPDEHQEGQCPLYRRACMTDALRRKFDNGREKH
jgi:hypothetical protein